MSEYELFDIVSEAIYFGPAYRSLMRQYPAAYEAMKTLASLIKVDPRLRELMQYKEKIDGGKSQED